MSKQSRVAIIGRPNVGKSTLFNILTDSRKAVVKDQPGVTRDINVAPVEWCGATFDLLDTGGITDTEDQFSKLVKEKVLATLGSVDLIIAVMDGRAGLCPEDRDVMKIVHRSEKPFLIVVNKVDAKMDEETAILEFYELGPEVISAAFEQRRAVDDILEWIVTKLPPSLREEREQLTLAVLGKPNAGKSSLCNYILGEDRMIVSEIAGTTIDAVDLEIEYKDKRYLLIDTAGLRKKAKRKEGVEILSSFKSEGAIHRADVVLLLIDGTLGPSDQDAKIVEKILDEHKGVILVANKSDLGEKEIPAYRKKFRAQSEEVFHFFDDIPIAFISAKTGAGIEDLFKLIDNIWEKLNFRISTSQLNKFFTETIRLAPAPVAGTKAVIFYYITQTRQRPPSFIAFANHPEGVTNSYRRFLSKKIKENWSLEGIPIRIFAMKKGKRS